MAKNYDDNDGVWRTIGGRRVFIKNGQSLSEAMIASGKFKNLRSTYKLDKLKKEEKEKFNILKNKGPLNEENKEEIENARKELVGAYRERKDYEKGIAEEANESEFYKKLSSEDKNKYDDYLKQGYSEKDIENTLMYKTQEDNMKEAGIKFASGEETKALQEKANEVVKNISSSDTIDELMNADTGDWNNMNQAERDKTCENILNDYEEKYGDKLKDEKFRKEVLDGLEDQNFHTMGKIIEQKYGNSDDLSDLSTKEKELMASIKKEESERLEIAKEIAKEIYGKNMGEELLERKAKEILEPQEGEVLEKGDQPFTNSNGELERSTNYLKEWQKELKQTSGNFVQKSTSPFYPDREYTKEDLQRMEDNGIKPMESSYSGSGWKGVNSDKHLSTKEQAKAITDAMKEQYPDVKISRKSDVYSGGSSIDFNIMSSDKDLYISDADIDKLGDEQLFNTDITRGYGFERWANENVPNYKTEHSYSVDDVKKYAKEQLKTIKEHENQNVRGNEWYLSDYGKNVVSELNKQANSYTYDDSDAMTDYFNHGTYMDINIGKWNKPYQVNEKPKSTNDIMNNAIRESKYKSAKHEGFGDYNKDNIPVYDNKIDYTGDFGRNANLSSLSSKELQEAIRVQTEELNKAKSEKIGDQRTRNGKMDKIFNTAKVQKYEEGVKLLKEEAIKRENDKYPQYKGTDAEVKYYSVEDVAKDPNSKMNLYIKEQAQKKAYKKYLKLHPNSEMKYEEFKNKNSK